MYDPLGLINPICTNAKVFLQYLWKLDLNWDESLPQIYDSQWENFFNQLSHINGISVPRFIIGRDIARLEVHAFCYASLRAYGACIYVRSINDFGSIVVNLVSGKSKVAPIKTRSLAELELCGALLLSKLLVKVKQSIPLKVDMICCWSDSEIVLNWISAHPSTWTTFVANRVTKIQENTADAKWNHIHSKDNPADLSSRGVLPENCATINSGFPVPHSSSNLQKPGQSLKENSTYIRHPINVKWELCWWQLKWATLFQTINMSITS
jgi:hypothetical protein